MKRRIINGLAGLALLGVSTDTPSPPKGEVAPPDTPHTRKFSDDKFTRIQPTKEGAETIKRLAAQGEELIKRPSKTGNTNISKKNLEWLASVIKDLPGASLKTMEENGYHHALVIKGEDKKEDVWYIDSIGPGAAVFPFFGFFASAGFTFVNKDDPHMIAVYEGSDTLKKNDLLKILDAARRDGISQKNDPAGVKKFDLTKKRPIGYLCFNGFDEGDKPSRKQYYEYSHALPELLKSCGYDMVCLDDKNRIEEIQWRTTASDVAGLVANPTLGGMAGFVASAESSTQVIEKRIAALHRQGVRDFYLNFLTHGDNKKGMLGYDGSWLKGEDIKKILLKYSDCTFAIDATGCEGGGLIGMMREFRDVPEAPEGRVGVFVHTHEEFSTFSLDYQSLLVKMLADMADGVKDAPQTYGEAHYGTDMHRRRLSNGRHDPEFWKSMPGQPSIRTAKNDMSQPNPLVEATTESLAGNTPPASPDGSQPRREWTGTINNDANHDEKKGRC